MRIFRKEEDAINEFVERLQETPDVYVVCTHYVAIWSSIMESVIIHPGNFSDLSGEEINLYLAGKANSAIQNHLV